MKQLSIKVMATLLVAVMMISTVPLHIFANEIRVSVNGQVIEFLEPVRTASSTLLAPMRPFADAIGAELRWNGDTRTATIILGNTGAAVAMDNPVMVVRNMTTGAEERVTLPINARVYGSTSFIPVEAVAIALGLNIRWSASTQTWQITTPGFVASEAVVTTPTTTPAVAAAAPISLTALDFLTASPHSSSNTWTVTAGGDSRTLPMPWTDNTGTGHTTGGIISGGQVWGNWSSSNARNTRATGNEQSISYLLNRQFARFTGTIALSFENRDAQQTYQIRIWGDGTLLYTSPEITGGTLPVRFDIDVSNVIQLRIERLASGSAQIAIASPTLHPIGAIPAHTVHSGRSAVATRLTDMDFFTTVPQASSNTWAVVAGTHARSKDSTFRDNLGNSYVHGGIISGGQVWGNWSSSNARNTRATGNEHSITYLLNGNYNRFTGVIALSFASRDSQLTYQIRLWGDGTLLYTSPEISGGTLPIPFEVNVTGVTQLRIERLAGGDAEIAILNPGLHH